MESDKNLIDIKLIEIRENILKILSPGYYLHKAPSVIVDSLNITVNGNILELERGISTLPHIDYLQSQLTEMIQQLEEKFNETRFQNLPKVFLKARAAGWNNIKTELNKINSEIAKSLNDESLEIDCKFPDIVLTRDQLVLLIQYLREEHLISSSVSDINVATYFHKMTGFSDAKLQQKLAGKGKSQHNLITDWESNYDKLKEIFNAIINRINDDKRQAILKRTKKTLSK